MERHAAPISDDAASPEERALLEEWVADRGRVGPPGEIWRVLLHAPEGMRRVGKLGAFARLGTSLPEQLRVVCSFIAAAHRGFGYEIDLQTANLLRLGFQPEQVAALRSGDLSDLDPDTAAVARIATSIALHRRPQDGDTAAVADLLGDRGLVEVALVTGYFLMLSDVAGLLLPDDTTT